MSPRVRAFSLLCACLAVLVAFTGARAQAPQDDDEPRSPLLKDPETVEGAFEATLLMVDIARPQLARRYLELMLSMRPDDETLLELREEHGATAFLKLAGVKELRPLSEELLDRVNEAFRQRARDPERVDSLITQLAGSPAERAAAILSLREGGPDVVPRMLERVGSPQFAGKQDAIVFGLAKLGKQVVPPLVAALQATDPAQRGVAIEALGWVGDESVIPELWSPAFGPGQDASVRAAARQAIARIRGQGEALLHEVTAEGVVRKLTELAKQHLAMQAPLPTEDDGLVHRWGWLPEEGRVGRITLEPRLAALHDATRYSREALAMAPELGELQALHLAARTGLALERNGWDRGLPIGPGTAHDLALTAGDEVASEGLELALEAGNAVAAMAMLNVLSEVGRTSDLYRVDSPSPIVVALDATDQRVRFAAANTILQLDPRKTFPHASRVVEVLARAISEAGGPRVTVADSSVARGRTMAGLFGQLGFLPTSVRTGKDAFRFAAEHADVEMVVIESNVARWPLSQTIANFRADARTATTPIVVYSTHGRTDGRWIEGLVRRYEPIHFIDWSIREEAVLERLRPFVNAIPPPLTEEQRDEQTAVAVYWLSHIAGGRRTDVFNLAPAAEALFGVAADPDLGGDAVVAIGGIPTPAAQQRLQELAVNPQHGVAIRRAAAVQLAYHVQRHGLLLGREGVAGLLQAWRDATDAETASRLAAVVGLLKPNAARVGERLLEAPPPAPPVAVPDPAL